MAEHISYTQLNMFLRCGEQYRRRYLEKHIIPPSAALIRGKCCHKAEEKNFRQKIETKKDLPLAAVKDYFSDEWNESHHQIAFREDELNGDSPKKAGGRIKDSGLVLTEVFHKEQAPIAHPIAVEDDFQIDFEGGYLPLIGYIDRIDNDVYKDKVVKTIAEHKFVSKSPPKDSILSDTQLTVEDLGFRSKFGKPPDLLMKQWAVATKTPKTVIQTCIARDQETINHLLWRLEAFMETLEKGNFLPAPNDCWWCSEKWCGYWLTCKYRQ